MLCPRCSVAEISPVTGVCELCGHVLGAAVAVEHADAPVEIAKRELAHEFELSEIVGQGAASVVFRARERSSGRRVILKALPRSTNQPKAEEHFRETLGAFASFDHPHLVSILRFGSSDSLFWHTRDVLDSVPLRERLRADGRLDVVACRRLVTQIVSVLDYLHRRGVVHGAVKTDNVLVNDEGWVHVCDPSIVRAQLRRPPRRTPTGSATAPSSPPPRRPPWMAPEEFERGERRPAADQFALAALVYECLTGLPPRDPPASLLGVAVDVPAHVAHAVDRALSPEPQQRFPSCADFLWALEEEGVAAPAARPSGRITKDVVMISGWKPPDEPRRWLTAAVRVLSGVAVVAVLWFAAPAVIGVFWPSRAGGAGSAGRSTPAVAVPQSEDRSTSTPTGAATARAQRPTAVQSGLSGSTTTPGSELATRESRAASEAPAPATPREAPSAPVSRRGTTSSGTPSSGTTSSGTTSSGTTSSGATRSGTTPSGAVSASARLFVNSSPWGRLFIDGDFVGNTPKANLELTPGQHMLRVTRDGYVSFERSLQVAAGEVIRLTDIVLEPNRPR